MRTVALSLLLLATVTAGSLAQPPRVLRKPAAEYLAAKSEGPDNAIFKADLSPDGKLVACVRQGGRLTVYAVGDAQALFTTEPTDLRGSTYTSGAAFSADGKLLAFPGKGKRIEIVSARTGKPHASLELPPERLETVDALAFSPDGGKLAVSSGVLYHKDLHVFDTATGKLLGQPLNDVDGMAYQLIFSADGKRLIANHGSTIYLVDAVAQRLTAKVRAEAAAVFFRGEKLLVVEAPSLAVRELTVEGMGKKSLGQFAEKSEAILALRTAIAGDPAIAAMPLKNEVSVRNIEGRELFRVAGEDSPIRRVCLSADGRVLLIYRDSLRVEVFRLE
jgi:hypothetical protein